MINKFYTHFVLLILAIGACLLPLQYAAAASAEQSFADGNRLFRDDLYWAALLRYRQAADDGMDTPLLHYNTGIAHYRAGQHIRARESLEKALTDPSLRIVTEYNLGLNAYALGQTDEALRWFRLARDQESDKKIQRFAVTAISRIRDELAVPDEFEVRVAKREEVRNFTDLQLHARLGFGSDSNAFRSPDQPYIDYSDPNTPVVIPVVQSGTYIPLSLSAKYVLNSMEFEGFYVRYRLTGRYYTDELLENANAYQHEASFGSEYHRKEDGRERRVRGAFTVAQNDEVYYDPDDGLPHSVNGVDIEDRMNYVRYGPQVYWRQAYEHLAFAATVKGQLWSYEEQEDIAEYDHDYYYANLYGQYKFTDSSLFRTTLEGYSRRYSDRPAFDLDGQQRAGNPNIRYDYYSLELTYRHRLFDNLWLGLDLERTERVDQYVGYNDYARDSVSFEAHWAPNARFKLEGEAAYRLYDYPNAFAFHEPTAANKTQESADARLTATYQMTRHFSLVGEALYRETVSNDTRIQYERYQYTLGVRWER